MRNKFYYGNIIECRLYIEINGIMKVMLKEGGYDGSTNISIGDYFCVFNQYVARWMRR